MPPGEAGESSDPGSAGFRLFRWKILVAGLQEAALIKQRLVVRLVVRTLADLSHFFVDRRFLLLKQLALAGVGLVAIPVEWNVAAGHHDAAFSRTPAHSMSARVWVLRQD